MATASTKDNASSPKTKPVRVRRTFSQEVVQEWHVQIPTEYDMGEWMANDEHGFREHLRDQGQIVLESRLGPDPDEDEITIMTPGENL